MTLAEAEMKRSVRIVGFRGLDDRERSRLSSIGLRSGACVTKLLRTPLLDPVECLVGPQLLAIDAWLLDRIVVDADGHLLE